MSNGSGLFGVVNALLSLAKERQNNGHGGSSTRTKNKKVKCSLYKGYKNYDLGRNLGLQSYINLRNEQG